MHEAQAGTGAAPLLEVSDLYVQYGQGADAQGAERVEREGRADRTSRV